MSLELAGLGELIKGQDISLSVKATHTLVVLGNKLDWRKLYEIVEADLKRDCQWHLGRKMEVQIHLGVFLLQHQKQYTDRQMEEELRYNTAYQVFCGREMVLNWHCPDHTKIEKFRNRLSAETQRQLVNEILRTAVTLGYANPTQMDVDSTVQEANISYPSDARLLLKLAEKTAKVLAGCKDLGTKAVESLRNRSSITFPTISIPLHSYALAGWRQMGKLFLCDSLK
ncbi:MAG: transposase [SAR324 cluster bacterium]|nr:transposase [SAR324 cluster bacterium]